MAGMDEIEKRLDKLEKSLREDRELLRKLAKELEEFLDKEKR